MSIYSRFRAISVARVFLRLLDTRDISAIGIIKVIRISAQRSKPLADRIGRGPREIKSLWKEPIK